MRLPESLRAELPRRPVLFDACAAALVAVLTISAWGERHPRPRDPAWAASMRTAAVARIGVAFDPPVSHWVSGLLLGDDSGFNEGWKDVFRRTGTTHLTAVSGFNIMMVLNAARLALCRLPLPRHGRLLVLAATVVLFVFLTGRPASVLRAALLVGMVEVARLFGRPVKPLRALLLVLIAAALWDARLLASDLGFQLSVLAAFGLAAFGPPLRASLFRRWPKEPREWASQTLAATIAVSPLIAWLSDEYSLVAFPANIFVALAIPYLMAGGALLAILAFAAPPLAAALGGLAEGLFAAPLVALRALSAVPSAALHGHAAVAALLAAQAAALLLLLRWRRRESGRYLLDL